MIEVDTIINKAKNRFQSIEKLICSKRMSCISYDNSLRSEVYCDESAKDKLHDKSKPERNKLKKELDLEFD